MKNNKFRLWIPLEKIQKSKDKDGNTVMKLGGIASTTRRDMDGESLTPDGFDTSYFEEKGIVNWNHNKSPDAVIGEPCKVQKRNGELYVETLLYPDNPLAKSVYELAETLQKGSKTRRLGYSIEGKATHRDLLDKSIVKKARITNIALTISPKNPDSKVDIIKGMFTESDDEYDEDNMEKSMDDMITEVDALLKSSDDVSTGSPSLGASHIVDIERTDGMRITVDSAYNVKIEKSLGTEDAGASKLSREHVDKQKRKLKANEPNNMDCDEMEDDTELQKANLVNRILEINPVISFTNAFNISKNIIDMAKKKDNKITEDVIEKALQGLGYLEKSVDTTEDDDDDDEDMEKGEDEEEMYNDEGKDDEEKEDKKPAPKKKSKPAAKKEDDDEDEEDDDEEMEKGVDDTRKPTAATTSKKAAPAAAVPAKKDMNLNKLQKSLDQTNLRQIQSFKHTGTMLKGMYDMLKETNELMKGVQEENKTMVEEIQFLKDELEKANDNIETLSGVPNKRKSIVKATERSFEKGVEDDFKGRTEDNTPKISVKNKKMMLGLLDQMTFEKGGFRDDIAKAMTTYESSGNLSNDIAALIKRERGITITN